MEIKSLTGIRGVFALYVVFFHLFPRVYSEGINNLITNGYLAVDFFFLLSGFIMSMVHNEFSVKGRGDYVNFIYKRFCRIYPLYAFLLIVTLIISYLHSGAKENPVSIIINTFLLQSAFGYNYIQSSWSISTELFAYLLFPAFLYTISNSKYIIPVIIASVAILIYLSINNTVLSLSLGIAGGWQAIARCLADYALGITTFILYKKGFYINKTTSYIITCFIIYCLFNRAFDIYVVIFCALLIPALIDNSNLLSKTFSFKPIHYLGEISYSLYLIHSILINQLNFIFINCTYYKTAIIVSSIIFSVVTYHFIEKPCRHFLNNLLKNMKFKVCSS